MDAEETIFERALGIESPEERDNYLQEACAGNKIMLERLQGLLRAHERAGGFLEHARLAGVERSTPLANAAEPTAAAPNLPLIEKPGERIGRYKLLQKIGEGGCGVVYMAEQEEPVRRRVALKVIKLGMDTKQVIGRFQAERQALALMDHPNIAKVFDAGATETGRPYFVMELVRGVRITQYCDEKKLTTPQRLELFMQVCRAVQHAHQKGIIHRDLKPSNILVSIDDGEPVPKVIDFGIAKATTGEPLTDKTVFTAFEQFIGTPAYMSPEQALLTNLDIDTRADIYALGVLLYELLTGRTPFDAKELLQAGLEVMRRTICEHEPPRPSTRLSTISGDELSTTAQRRGLDPPRLLSQLRGDLDCIVMKCLEKDRARRYESANGLASDVQRHLSNEPVVACPPSALYRFQKLVRRNKVVFAAGIGIAAALVIGLAIALWQSVEKTRAYDRAVAAEQEQFRLREQAQSEAAKSQQVAQFLKDMLQGAGPEVAKGRDATILLEILDKTAERVSKELTNRPDVEADLQNTIGSTYTELGQYKKAELILRRALATNKQLHPEGALVVRDSLNKLGATLYSQGNLTEAEALNRESLALNRKLLGNEHPGVVSALNDLTAVLTFAGKYAEAKVVGQEAVALMRKLPDTPSADLASELTGLTEADRNLGNFAEAEAGFREAVAIMKKASNEDSRELEMALNGLALMLDDQKRFAEAEAASREALAMDQRLLGNQHPEVIVNMNNLASILAEEKKYEEAEQLSQEALELARKLPAGNEKRIAHSLHILAETLRLENKLAEAESRAREALTVGQKVVADDDPLGALFVVQLARILTAEGKYQEAEDLYNEWVRPRQQRPLADGTLIQARGGFYARRGRWKEAETDLTSALAVSPEDSATWHSLAAIFVQENDMENYRQHCRKSSERFAQATDPATNHRIALDCLLLPSSGTDLRAIGAMADRAVALGTNDPALTSFQFARSLSEYRQGRFSSAAEGLHVVLLKAGESPTRDVMANSTLAMTHFALKQPAQARAALAAGLEIEQAKLSKPGSGDLGEDWVGWILAHALLGEAKGIIEGGAK